MGSVRIVLGASSVSLYIACIDRYAGNTYFQVNADYDVEPIALTIFLVLLPGAIAASRFQIDVVNY